MKWIINPILDIFLFSKTKMRFEILELQNRVTKLSYAKWRHASSYLLEKMENKKIHFN